MCGTRWGGKDRTAIFPQLIQTELRIHVVQELMGHADVKTTEIYTHVRDGLFDPVFSGCRHLRSYSVLHPKMPVLRFLFHYGYLPRWVIEEFFRNAKQLTEYGWRHYQE